MRARLSNIETFCLTYELGNFTQAAKKLGVTPQAASRSVARLEKDLGVTLFRRNTRHVEPTEAGRVYYEACLSALGTLDQVESRLSGQDHVPAGEVRVSVPTTYGHHRFVPMLADFRRAFPKIDVDVQISNENVDFVRQGYDLAIRMGALEDASFVARKLGDFSLGVFGHPDYFAECGVPKTPEDLHQHACGVFVMPRTGRILPWTFDPEPKSLLPNVGLRIRDDVLGLVTFARAGGGLIQLYHYLVEREIERGELKEVLTKYAGRSRPFSLIYLKEAVSRIAVRTLVDFIMEATKDDRR